MKKQNEMKSEIKMLIKDILKRKNDIEVDDEGKKVIRIFINNDDEFVSPYSTNGSPVLSGETAEFLNHSLKHLKFKDQIHFVMESNCIDDKEKNVYQHAIKNYYRQEFIENRENIKHKTILSIIMLLIGALIFSLAIALSNLSQVSTLILDILDVIAWVFVWEAVDLFALQRTVLKRQQVRYLQIMLSKISFEDAK